MPSLVLAVPRARCGDHADLGNRAIAVLRPEPNATLAFDYQAAIIVARWTVFAELRNNVLQG